MSINIFESMSDNIFERASRIKLRFDTSKGKLVVEDLWILPLSSKTNDRLNLDSMALDLDSQLQKQNKSFVKDISVEDSVTQLKFDIIKYIIDTKIAENKLAYVASVKAAKRQQIIDIIAKKQDEAIGTKSIEELTVMLNDL